MKFKMGFPDGDGRSLVGAKRLIHNYGRLHLVATLVGLTVVMPAFYLLWAVAFPQAKVLALFDEPPGIFIGTLLGIIVVHEFVHLFALPGLGFGDKAYMGFDRKTHLPYVAYLGDLTRTRAFLVAIMPALVLSVLPFVIARVSFQEHLDVLASCSILNAGASTGDFCIACLVFWRIPRGAIIRGEFYAPGSRASG